MDIKRDRMVYLGYGKYWRSDQIVGLLPIEEERGPGRRTEVYVANREEPVIASRAEDTILRDVVSARGDASSAAAELRSAAAELIQGLRGLSPVMRRMLKSEGGLDVAGWGQRLDALIGEKAPEDEDQEDLFEES